MFKNKIILLAAMLFLFNVVGCEESNISDSSSKENSKEQGSRTLVATDSNFSDANNSTVENMPQENSSASNDASINTEPYDLTISLNVDDQEFDVFAGTWETDDHVLQFTIDATSNGYFAGVNIPGWDYRVENVPFDEKIYTSITIPENAKSIKDIGDWPAYKIQEISAYFHTMNVTDPHGSIEFFPLKIDNTLTISYHFEGTAADPAKRFLDGEMVSCNRLESRQYSSEPDFSKSVGKWIEDRDPHKCYEITLVGENEYGIRFSTSDGYMTNIYKLNILEGSSVVEIDETNTPLDDNIYHSEHYRGVYGKISLSVDRFGTPTLNEANLYSDNGESRVLGTVDSQLVPFTDDIYNFYWIRPELPGFNSVYDTLQQ